MINYGWGIKKCFIRKLIAATPMLIIIIEVLENRIPTQKLTSPACTRRKHLIFARQNYRVSLFMATTLKVSSSQEQEEGILV